jgi:hypothetical protein
LRKCLTNKEENQGQIQKINKEIEDIISDKTALLKFNGKAILGRFYDQRIPGKDIGMSFEVFCYSIADRIGKNGRIPESIKKTLMLIQERLKKAHEQSEE